MERNRIHERLGSRHARSFIISLIILTVIILSGLLWQFVSILPVGRITIVAAGEAMTVLSWDGERGKLGVIVIPADVRVEGIYNTGELPVSSLLKLEELDPNKQGLFVGSIRDALGLPIAGVMRTVGSAGAGDAIGSLSPFSPTGWQRGSGVSVLTRFRLWWLFKNLRPDGIWAVNLEGEGVFQEKSLPDGSRARIFDTDRFDLVAGSRLETDSIRREMTRVLIINTTDASGLGGRVARTFGRAGMVVVAVESDHPAIPGCTLHANKEMWDLHAVQFIRQEYACVLREEGTDERADVTVRLGDSNAKQYE